MLPAKCCVNAPTSSALRRCRKQPSRRTSRELRDLQQHVEARLSVYPFQRLDASKRLANAKAARGRIVSAHDFVRLSANEVRKVRYR